MGIELNHTIVRVRDKRESAQFLAEMLGLGAPVPFGPFLAVQTGNDVSLDFADDHGPVSPQHYAFLVSESDFDQIFGRIQDRRLRSGRPGPARAGRDQHQRRRPGVYWEDPSGHFLEIITRPYGSGRWPRLIMAERNTACSSRLDRVEAAEDRHTVDRLEGRGAVGAMDGKRRA